jgi:hypothetical protein
VFSLFNGGTGLYCAHRLFDTGGVKSEKENFEKVYAGFFFNRKLLLFTHSILGFFSVLAYVSQLQLKGFQYSAPRGISIIFMAAPVLFPLFISAVYSHRIGTHSRLRACSFIAILTAGSVATILLYTGAFNMRPSGLTVLCIMVAQITGYTLSAKLLLNIEQ